MTGTRFDVLGPLHVRQNDELMTITGQKNRTVISCLALHPEQTISMDTLLRAAWSDPQPRSAVHQVRKMISALRLGIEQGWDLVRTSQEGYLLRVTPEQSDLADFTRRYARVMSGSLNTDEELAAAYDALALWRGRPCEGSLPSGCEERVAELVEQHRSLLLKTFRAFSDRGREDELVAVLQTAAKIHGQPVQEAVATEPARPPSPVPVVTSAPPGGSPLSRVGTVGGHCLPRDLKDFSGREEEGRRLHEYLLGESPGPFVVTVHGMGGVGKTALALHTAHQLAPHFPDGQLFVNLDGVRSPEAQSVRNTLGVLLRQLGMAEEDIPSSQESRLARWREVTAGRRHLLVLDDAAGLAQVEPLMPASEGSACIITSRVVLSGIDGAAYLRLEVPGEDECVELLRSIVGDTLVDQDPKSVRSVIRQFENLPLALRLAGARLSTREFVSFGELARSLQDSSSPVDEVELPGRSLIGRLDTSLTSMEPSDLDRYLRLALLPAPELDEVAASVAIGGGTDQARRACRRFTDRALLQRVATGTYRMHPLLAQTAALHIERSLSPAVQRSVIAAALEYYKNAVGLIGSARVSPSPGPSPALLFGTLTRAAQLAEELDLRNAFADLCLAWERPVNLYLDTDQQQTVWDLALAAAHDHPDRSIRGNIRLAVSRCLWHRNEMRAGMQAARLAWFDAQEADDHLLRVRSLLRSSSFCWLTGETAEGLRYLAEARGHLRACQEQAGEAAAGREAMEIMSNEAALLAERREFARAAELSQRVIDADGIDARVTIMAKVTQAAAQLGLGNYGQALWAGTAALHEANQIRSAYGRSLALQQMARTLRAIPHSAAASAAEAAQASRSAVLETGSLRIVDEIDAFLDSVPAAGPCIVSEACDPAAADPGREVSEGPAVNC
ncbi:hypothetical protein Kisp01_58770 [Kineosporia sp. NBRC 101677]|uniref:AfsR/SARP family transcriptional regulator n=1 Tax=Kineosporia sp. NBRC 101677 TaxID=3032197 RepID=UPI0024A3B1BC|nr:NB-ARC domain-containing protein [Kineosporia sp. NBRC 101677]GLY18863.1 hypothetical protein Kisp01_58770 [Kineosporia sp. NBRC 101677]